MNLPDRLIDAADVSAGRFTALFGVYFVSGTAFMALATLLGAFPNGSHLSLYLNAASGFVVGVVALAWRKRALPRVLYLVMWIAVSAALSAVVLTVGPDRVGVAGVLFVYISCLTFVAFRSVAPYLLAIAATPHLIVLLVQVPRSEALGIWAITWGVASIAGVVVGDLVESNRRAVIEREGLLLELQRADQAKTALLNAVNHELSRPMTVMQGLAQTVAERGEHLSPEARKHLMERVAAGSVRMGETLQELLGVSRLSAGQVTLDLQQQPLERILDLAVERAEVGAGRVEVRVTGPIEVRADRGRLALAVTNLITNAVRYGGDGGPVEVVGKLVGERVQIRVADHGPGIPDEVKQAVFEPFVRARDSDVGKGTGVGLSLVKQLARLHGGEAWIEDRRGGGAVAVISVPQDGPR